MVQNHMLQLLCMSVMNIPHDRDTLRDAKVNILRHTKNLCDEYGSQIAVRGQYDGYRMANNIAEHSVTETYVAVPLSIVTESWQ